MGRPENVLGTSWINLPGTSLDHHFRTSLERQIGTSPRQSNRIFRGRRGDVGGRRPQDVLGTNTCWLGNLNDLFCPGSITSSLIKLLKSTRPFIVFFLFFSIFLNFSFFVSFFLLFLSTIWSIESFFDSPLRFFFRFLFISSLLIYFMNSFSSSSYFRFFFFWWFDFCLNSYFNFCFFSFFSFW